VKAFYAKATPHPNSKTAGENEWTKLRWFDVVETHVKSVLALALLFSCAAAALPAAAPQQSQQPPLPARRAIRIPVRHADPWFIKFALEGQPLVSPELSTLFFLMGVPQGAANAANGLLDGGRLLVNPTDNSLWWYPD
jgi:hypothetical protein